MTYHLRIAAAAVLILALTSGGAAGGPERPVPGADEVPIDHLCGIAQPLDEIFGCAAAGAGAAPGQPPPSGEAEAPSSGENVRATSLTPRYLPNVLAVTFR